MHTNTFLNTAGTILSEHRLNSNPNNARTKIKNLMTKTKISKNPKNNYIYNNYNISTIINNRSITTNESSGINNTSYMNNTNNRRSFNPRIKKYVPLNTVGTDKSTWYHTKTVASIMREKQRELNEADEIMKEREKRGLGGGIGGNSRKKMKILEKSREICLDNYMITQLRQKRTEISKNFK